MTTSSSDTTMTYRDIVVRDVSYTTSEEWDHYVLSRESCTCYHLSAWMRSIEKAYSHPCHWIVARRRASEGIPGEGQGGVCGVLPLVHVKHFLFGNALVSLPFADLGGILADEPAVEIAILRFAEGLRKKVGAKYVELRSSGGLAVPGATDIPELLDTDWKVLMTRDLPADPERLFQEFKSKLRSQIRKPEKDGMRFRMEGEALLGDFYRVYCRNMRDLGSPVHSKEWFHAIVDGFGSRVRLGVVYHSDVPVAAGMILACGDTISIPWASSLREYNSSSPNMMLYWNFMIFACENGYKRFDFGRCTAGSGTHKFKVQWGPVETPIRRIMMGESVRRTGNAESGNQPVEGSTKREVAMRMWKKAPIGIANIIGPRIRKYITL